MGKTHPGLTVIRTKMAELNFLRFYFQDTYTDRDHYNSFILYFYFFFVRVFFWAQVKSAHFGIFGIGLTLIQLNSCKPI